MPVSLPRDGHPPYTAVAGVLAVAVGPATQRSWQRMLPGGASLVVANGKYVR